MAFGADNKLGPDPCAPGTRAGRVPVPSPAVPVLASRRVLSGFRYDSTTPLATPVTGRSPQELIRFSRHVEKRPFFATVRSCVPARSPGVSRSQHSTSWCDNGIQLLCMLSSESARQNWIALFQPRVADWQSGNPTKPSFLAACRKRLRLRDNAAGGDQISPSDEGGERTGGDAYVAAARTQQRRGPSCDRPASFHPVASCQQPSRQIQINQNRETSAPAKATGPAATSCKP